MNDWGNWAQGLFGDVGRMWAQHEFAPAVATVQPATAQPMYGGPGQGYYMEGQQVAEQSSGELSVSKDLLLLVGFGLVAVLLLKGD